MQFLLPPGRKSVTIKAPQFLRGKDERHEAEFFGADQCVTGSCHCLEVGGKRILIDCGLQQGRDEVDNRSLPFAPGSIDYVLITHAHIDHSGRCPCSSKTASRAAFSPPGSRLSS